MIKTAMSDKRLKNIIIGINNLSINESLKKGTELSAKVIQKIGARI